MWTRFVRSVIEMLQSQLTMGTLHPEISPTLGTVHSYIIYNAGYRYIYTLVVLGRHLLTLDKFT